MIRDRAVFFGWIAGLLIAIALIWIAAKPLHARYLMVTVNKVLINSGDDRRLSSYLEGPKGNGMLGYWYTMTGTNDLMFVFAIFQEGILVPCGAIVKDDGEVGEIIPLSAHAGQVFNKIQKNVMRIYIQRIEAAAHPGGQG